MSQDKGIEGEGRRETLGDQDNNLITWVIMTTGKTPHRVEPSYLHDWEEHWLFSLG